MSALRSNDLVAFIPTTNPKRARAFFEKTLGLEFVSDDGFALVFEAHGIPIRVVNVASVPSYVPAQFTILGWQVPDIRETVRDLVKRGVAFERYEGMGQDEDQIWTAPGGARIAWFKDPDGNILSLSEHQR